MSVIIGAGTTIPEFNGVITVSWGIDPSVTRLWQLGSWEPYDSFIQARQTLTITAYGGAGNISFPQGTWSPAQDCEDSPLTTQINLFPASCSNLDTILDDPSAPWFLEAYSYSKGDFRGFGQETFNWFRHIQVGSEPLPDYVLLGIVTGQRTRNSDGLDVGISFLNDQPDAEGYQGGVSAGFPGLGDHDIVEYGVVNRIAGGDGRNDGKKGNANCQCPHTPLWL
jgi:hypothetical protein